MKALVKRSAEPGIWMEDVPVPTISMNEVLIKVEKTAICGTDLHIYNWDEWSQRTIEPPLVIGHEFVGEIVELGPGVHNYSVGDRVSAEGHITCGMCRNCRAGRRHLCTHTRGIGVNRDGAFAEFIAVPASNLWLIPQQIPSDFAACFDPLGNATHCALSFAVGRTGFSGFMAASAAAYRGMAESHLEEHGALVFEKHLARQIYPESRALVRAHQEMGHTVAVVSSATSSLPTAPRNC